MNIEAAIYEFFDKFFRTKKVYTVIGTVSNVNEATRTCDVTPIEGAKIESVKFQATLSGTVGFVLIPADGSAVAINCVNDEAGIIVNTGSIDKLIVKIGSQELTVTTSSFKFNGGTQEMVKIDELTTKLNLLKTEVNAFITAYNAHVHPVPTATALAIPPAVGTTAVTPASATPATAFNKNDYKDTNILHV